MIFHVIVEPTAEREIRSAVRWKTIRDDAVHVLYVRHSPRDELEP
jgi:hypothetical protein